MAFIGLALSFSKFLIIYLITSNFTVVKSQFGNPFPDAFKCPPEEDVDPCICDTNGEMECYGSKVTNEVLEDVFQRLVKFFATTQEKHLNALKLYKTEITQLEKFTLGEISLACIDINGNQNLSLNDIHRVTLVKSKEILTSFKYTGLSDAYLVDKQENDGAVFELVDGFMNLQVRDEIYSIKNSTNHSEPFYETEIIFRNYNYGS